MNNYDEKCHELAVRFLLDYDVISPATNASVTDHIAARIQRGIEDDLDDLNAEGKIRVNVRAMSPPGIERKEQKR
jgi:hypothetical protein